MKKENAREENEVKKIKKELEEIKTLLKNLSEQKKSTRNSSEIIRAPFLITFTDLVYGVVVALGLSFVPSILDTRNFLAMVLLGFAFLLIFDDWYGEHFYGAQPVLGNLWFLGDIAAFFIFFFYEYLSVRCSIFLLLAMAANGIRGIILDSICLRKFQKGSYRWSSASISLKYAIAFTLSYLLLFIVAVFRFQIFCLNGVLIISMTVGLWSLLRLIEYIAFRKQRKRYLSSSAQ